MQQSICRGSLEICRRLKIFRTFDHQHRPTYSRNVKLPYLYEEDQVEKTLLNKDSEFHRLLRSTSHLITQTEVSKIASFLLYKLRGLISFFGNANKRRECLCISQRESEIFERILFWLIFVREHK